MKIVLQGIWVYYMREYLLEVIIWSLGIYLIYKGYFNWAMFFKAMIILSLFIVYKWFAKKTGIEIKYRVDVPFLKAGGITEEAKSIIFSGRSDSVEKFKDNIDLFVNYKWCKKYMIIHKSIFVLFFLMPWNWLYFFILKLYEKYHLMIVLISSNIDIYYKKRGKENKIKNWIIKRWQWFEWLKWVINYPVWRLLLLPRRIRIKIFMYEDIKALIRLRLVGYFYGIMYLSIGYYEFVNNIWWGYKILFIYIILAVIWPLYIYYKVEKRNKWDEEEFRYPNYSDFFAIDKTSITFFVMYQYYKVVNASVYCEKICNYIFFFNMLLDYQRFILFWTISDERGYGILCRWRYEKTYGVSLMIFTELLKEGMINMAWLKCAIQFYYFGEKLFGKEIEQFEKAKKKMREWVKCRSFLIMDIRRLCGFDQEYWGVKPKEQYYSSFFFNELKTWDSIIEKKIPLNYQYSLELYKNISKNNFLLNQLTIHFNELINPYVEEGLIQKIMVEHEEIKHGDRWKKRGRENIDFFYNRYINVYFVLSSYNLDVINDPSKISDWKKKKWEEIQGHEEIEEWTNIDEKEYITEYTKLICENVLISEKYIKEYYEKHKKY